MIVQDLAPGDTCRFQNPGVYVQGLDGSGNPQSLAAAVAAGMAGGGAATIADGADVAEGATTDAAVAAGAAGTVSAKLRRLTTDLTAFMAANHVDLDAIRNALITASSSVIPHFVLLGASQTQDIPFGARGWSVSFLTGTGTIGAVSVPAGFSDSDANTLTINLTVTTNSASSAYIRWNT